MTSRPKRSGARTHGHIVILALLLTAWAFPRCGVSAEPSVSDYQEIHEGELPIILESPHGGMKEIPITRPDPPIGGYDKYTLELTQLIRERMIERTGKSPEMVAMLANRAFIDVNRGAGESAYRHDFTKQLYEAHYAAIDAAVMRVKKRYGKGLMVLIHSGWRYPVQIAIGVNHVKERCTVPWFVERYGWDEFHGTNGMGGRLFARGYQVPGFGGTVGPDAVGVPALTRCRMKENFGIDGIQFEFQGRTLLADVQKRQKLANDVADTLLEFVNAYYVEVPFRQASHVGGGASSGKQEHQTVEQSAGGDGKPAPQP